MHYGLIPYYFTTEVIICVNVMLVTPAVTDIIAMRAAAATTASVVTPAATEAAVIPVRPVFAIRLPAQWKICSQTTAAVAAVTDASIVTTVAAVIPATTAAVATMIAAKPIVITHASMRFSEKADAVTAVVTVRSELP